MQLKQLIDSIPEGFSKTVYKSQTYSLIKTTYNTGDSIKIFAEELGGTDVISANIYSFTLTIYSSLVKCLNRRYCIF